MTKMTVSLTCTKDPKRMVEVASYFQKNPDEVCTFDVSNFTTDGAEISLGSVDFFRWVGMTVQIVKIVNGDSIQIFPPCMNTNEADNIKEIDLRSLSSLKSISSSFFCNLTSLSELDLFGMKHLESIGDDFLSGCTSIKKVTFPEKCVVTTIGNRFLSSCSSLIYFDLSRFTKLTVVGDSFLSNCGVLLVDTTQLEKVTLGNKAFENTVITEQLKGCFQQSETSQLLEERKQDGLNDSLREPVNAQPLQKPPAVFGACGESNLQQGFGKPPKQRKAKFFTLGQSPQAPRPAGFSFGQQKPSLPFGQTLGQAEFGQQPQPLFGQTESGKKQPTFQMPPFREMPSASGEAGLGQQQQPQPVFGQALGQAGFGQQPQPLFGQAESGKKWPMFQMLPLPGMPSASGEQQAVFGKQQPQKSEGFDLRKELIKENPLATAKATRAKIFSVVKKLENLESVMNNLSSNINAIKS